MTYHDSLSISRASIYTVTTTDWNNAMENLNLLRALDKGDDLLTAGIASFAARTAVTYSALGSDLISGDGALCIVSAADFISAGFTKVQWRAQGVVFCSSAMTGSPVGLKVYVGQRVRAVPASPAAPTSSYTQIGSAQSITNTSSTYTGFDTGWVDSGITANSIVDFGLGLKPDSAGTDNTGSFNLRCSITMKGV